MTTYNGYTNYATWAVSLWIDNDQGMSSEVLGMAHECLENVDELASRLEDYINNNNPLVGQENLFSDLLNSELEEVNWEQLAKGYIEAVKD